MTVDCEKFDRVALDLLYEELDELTSAAAKRHLEHCSRCRGIGSRLRATQKLGTLPLVEPPVGLKERILAAEKQASRGLDARQRVGRIISILAGYAMRPQLAMAALLLLMIGSSLLFLRARPGERSDVQVTERGVPESENESVALIPVPEKPEELEGHAEPPAPVEAPSTADLEPEQDRQSQERSKAAGDDTASAFKEAMAEYERHHFAEAEQRFDAIAATGGADAARAQQMAARAARDRGGCPAAIERFERLSTRYAGSDIGYDAAWQAAECYRNLGDVERAKRVLRPLLTVADYRVRAEALLSELEAQNPVVASRKAAEKPAAKAGVEAEASEGKAAAPPAKSAPATDEK
jgi:tetratricopeptide (TPR) repeat protein